MTRSKLAAIRLVETNKTEIRKLRAALKDLGYSETVTIDAVAILFKDKAPGVCMETVRNQIKEIL